MKFSNLKMGMQLSLVFGITLLLLSVVGITGFIGVGSLSDRTGEVLQTDGKFAEYSSSSVGASRSLPWKAPAVPAAATGWASCPSEEIALDDEEFGKYGV